MKIMASNDSALGLIETRGLIAAIEAADAMVKAAKVRLIGTELTTGAMVTVKVQGETGAVKASIAAGAEAASRVGELVAAHIIPRPHSETNKIIFDDDVNASIKGATGSIGGGHTLDDLERMPVRELRELARKYPELDIQGRDISKANKAQLIEQISKQI